MKALLLVVLFLSISMRVWSADALLAVAPRISVGVDAAYYSEDLVDFYGTAKFLFESPLLAKRVSKQFNDSPPSVVVQADQIPKTSILKISVTGAAEDQNQKYLDLLIQAFFDDRKQMRESTFEKKIDQLETAIKSTPEGDLKEKLKLTLQAVQLAQISYDDPWIRMADH